MSGFLNRLRGMFDGRRSSAPAEGRLVEFVPTPAAPLEERAREAHDPEGMALADEVPAAPEVPPPPTLDELRQRLAEDPTNMDFTLEVAQAAHAAGQLGEATQLLTRVAESVRHSDPARAVKALETIRKMGSAQMETFLLLADLHHEAGRMKDAEMALRGALRLDMTNPRTLTLLADNLVQQGAFRDAELCCQKMLQVDPRDPFAREKLGDIHAAQDKPEEAVKAWLMAAQSMLGMQERDEARRLFKRVLEKDPHNAPAHRELANLGPG